jgi:Na+/H+ antiporter NhaC
MYYPQAQDKGKPFFHASKGMHLRAEEQQWHVVAAEINLYLAPMTTARYLMLLAALLWSGFSPAQHDSPFGPGDFEPELPMFFIRGMETEMGLRCMAMDKFGESPRMLSIVVNGKRFNADFTSGKATFGVSFDRAEPLSIKAGGYTHVQPIRPMPLWLSIVPPLLVIALALAFKEVVSSLLAGILAGAAITGWYGAGFSGLWGGFLRVVDTYVVNAMLDGEHISVIVFSTLIGGLVAVVSRNGGMQAVVEAISRKASTPRSGQFVTWLLGVAVFFDDYANTLVVGNTMRPLTDRLHISREKLSYIVDSTAAPVAAIAFITTWIGAELGYIEGAMATINAGSMQIDQSAYGIFAGSLRYAFYPILALVFILLIVFSGRDYGPMYRAEISARNTGTSPGASAHDADEVNHLEAVKGAPRRMVNAVLPIAVVVLGTVAGLFATGHNPEVWSSEGISLARKVSITIGQSDSYKALLWSSMGGLVLAILLTVTQRIMPFGKAVDASIDGFKTMVSAVVILILAWSLASITEEMHTAEYLAQLAGGHVAPWTIPALTFLMAALVSFSTGSAWGTMAIVYPLMLPLVWELSVQDGLSAAASMSLFLHTTSTVMAGAVLGDHCSPISDTTILSSLATRCDHLEHVRTQIPYAATVGGVSLLLSLLTAWAALPWWLAYLLGIGILAVVVRYVGRKIQGI